MSANGPGLVIFDCDGVLVETEAVANHLLVRILDEDGYTVSYEDCRRRFVGRMLEDIQAEIESDLGRALRRDWSDHVRTRTEAEFAAGIQAIPGVRTQVEALIAANTAICVASSGRISKMQLTLGSSGLLPLLADVLYSAEMVGRGKPHPDLFLHAASQMGFAPEQCIVIEDSPFGVQAGIAAQMRVLAYAADPHADEEALKSAGATLFDSMDDLPDLLAL